MPTLAFDQDPAHAQALGSCLTTLQDAYEAIRRYQELWKDKVAEAESRTTAIAQREEEVVRREQELEQRSVKLKGQERQLVAQSRELQVQRDDLREQADALAQKDKVSLGHRVTVSRALVCVRCQCIDCCPLSGSGALHSPMVVHPKRSACTRVCGTEATTGHGH